MQEGTTVVDLSPEDLLTHVCMHVLQMLCLHASMHCCASAISYILDRNDLRPATAGYCLVGRMVTV